MIIIIIEHSILCNSLFLLFISFSVFGYELSHISMSSNDKICMHSKRGVEVPVECPPGESCYAIASAYFNNGTWSLRKYAQGCWPTTPQCGADECVMTQPDYVWVDHHFPRFCCCKTNFCNREPRFEWFAPRVFNNNTNGNRTKCVWKIKNFKKYILLVLLLKDMY